MNKLKNTALLSLICILPGCNPDLASVCRQGYSTSTGALLLERGTKYVALDLSSAGIQRDGKDFTLSLSAGKGSYPVNMTSSQRQKLDYESISIEAKWSEGADLKTIPARIEYNRRDAGQAEVSSIQVQGMLHLDSVNPTSDSKDYTASGEFEFTADHQPLKGSFQVESNQLGRVCTPTGF
ncbi:MAG: hypothetical protein ACAI44_39855 [Candidatus Sericytochromatia bacterium]